MSPKATTCRGFQDPVPVGISLFSIEDCQCSSILKTYIYHIYHPGFIKSTLFIYIRISKTMASMFLRPMLRPNKLGVGLGLSMSTFAVYRQRPMKLDSKRLFSETQQTAAYKPSKGNSFINPSSVKQISSGSVFGMAPRVSVSLWTTSDQGIRTMCWAGC